MGYVGGGGGGVGGGLYLKVLVGLSRKSAMMTTSASGLAYAGISVI